MSRFWVSLLWKPWDCRLTPPRGVSSPPILSFFERESGLSYRKMFTSTCGVSALFDADGCADQSEKVILTSLSASAPQQGQIIGKFISPRSRDPPGNWTLVSCIAHSSGHYINAGLAVWETQNQNGCREDARTFAGLRRGVGPLAPPTPGRRALHPQRARLTPHHLPCAVGKSTRYARRQSKRAPAAHPHSRQTGCTGPPSMCCNSPAG